MFTGIVTDVGTLVDVQHSTISTYVIKTAYDLSKIKIGASIACAGVCLTVVRIDGDQFVIEASKETLDKTTMSDWKIGHRINLEQALKAGQDLDGYWYSGHIDGVAKIVKRKSDGESIRFQFELPKLFAPFVAPKGSICLDGVALTVNEVEGNVFGVNIIPHTWKVTTFGELEEGQNINFEIDIVARYVARMMGKDVPYSQVW